MARQGDAGPDIRAGEGAVIRVESNHPAPGVRSPLRPIQADSCADVTCLGQVDDAIHLYKSGWSVARIGEHLRGGPTSVLTRREIAASHR